jgi:hypothetical protein
MRLDRETAPGIWVKDVLLDGEVQRYVQACDIGEGWVERCQIGPNGRPAFDHVKGEFIIDRLTGKIEVTWTNDEAVRRWMKAERSSQAEAEAAGVAFDPDRRPVALDWFTGATDPAPEPRSFDFPMGGYADGGIVSGPLPLVGEIPSETIDYRADRGSPLYDRECLVPKYDYVSTKHITSDLIDCRAQFAPVTFRGQPFTPPADRGDRVVIDDPHADREYTPDEMATMNRWWWCDVIKRPR